MTTLFTTDHEWLRIEGDVATIGVTDYAQSQLGDVVFVELPKIGRSLKKAEAAAVVESVKAASDVYAPISGEVLEVNEPIRRLILGGADDQAIETAARAAGMTTMIEDGRARCLDGTTSVDEVFRVAALR